MGAKAYQPVMGCLVLLMFPCFCHYAMINPFFYSSGALGLRVLTLVCCSGRERESGSVVAYSLTPGKGPEGV